MPYTDIFAMPEVILIFTCIFFFADMPLIFNLQASINLYAALPRVQV
jgi:hypothetical protein